MRGEQQAQSGEPPVKDLGAEAGLAAEFQASQLRIPEEDFDARHCDQYLLQIADTYIKDYAFIMEKKSFL